VRRSRGGGAPPRSAVRGKIHTLSLLRTTDCGLRTKVVMNPARKRTLLRVGVVLVAGLAVLVWALTHREREFVVENHSGQRIDRLSVTVTGETRTFQDIAAEAQASGTFKAGSDDHFDIEGHLADGTRIRASGKAGENFHFFILPGGDVRIRPSKNAPK
jgi:hypothetical protein